MCACVHVCAWACVCVCVYVYVCAYASSTFFLVTSSSSSRQPWGMIPLHKVQLHKCVDVEGQVIEKDLQSGTYVRPPAW